MPEKNAEIIKKLKLFFDAEDAERAASKVHNLKKAVGGLKTSVKSLLDPIGKFAALAGAGFGLSKSIGTVQDYYKTLLKLSSQMSKYGVGAVTVKKQMESLSSTLHLTRIESADLFASFEKGFPMVTIRGFEKIMKNIKNVVGSNAAAMKEMGSSLANLATQYPWLQQSMENLTKLDKERLESQLELLMYTGKLSLTQVRGIQDYIRQNKQSTVEDKKHIEQWMQFQEKMQDVRSSFENIAMVLGEAFIPLVKDLSSWMTKNKDTIVSITKFIGTWAARLGPAVIAFKAISGFGSGISSMGGGLAGLIPGSKKDCDEAKRCAADAAKGFWAKGKMIGAAKIFGSAMAGIAGGLIGKEIGGYIGKELGHEGAGQIIGGAAGGAIAGAQVGGLPGAIIGGGIGLLTSAVSMINDSFKDAGEEKLKKRLQEINDLGERYREAHDAGKTSDRTYTAQMKLLTISRSNDPSMKESIMKDIQAHSEGKDRALSAGEKQQKFWLGPLAPGGAKNIDVENAKKMIKAKLQILINMGKTKKAAEEELKKSLAIDKAEQDKFAAIQKQIRGLEIQTNLRSSLVGKLESELQLLLISNNSGDNTIKQSMEKADMAIKNEQSLAREVKYAAELRLKDAQKNKNKEKEAEETQLIADKTKQILDLEAKRLTLYKLGFKEFETEKEIQGGIANLMETQVNLLDQMGMGIGAPAEMRFRLIEQIGNKIVTVDKQLAELRESQAKGEENQGEIQKDILKFEQERLQLIQKQFSVSKSLREGWVGALSAMTVASGRITKIMITRQTHLATMLKNGGVVSNVSGALGGGAMGSSRFAVGLGGGFGITGGYNAGYQTEYGPDVRAVRAMEEGVMRGNLGQSASLAIGQLGAIQRKTTAGTSGAAYLSGPGMPAYKVPGVGGIRKAGGAVSPAGGITTTGGTGGWTSKGGCAILNIHIEVHSKAELIKALIGLANKLN